jgi:hypothetical protein
VGILPQRVIDRMSESDRKQYARHAGHPTAALTRQEIETKLCLEAERRLRSEIRQYLGLKQIDYVNLAKFPSYFTFTYRGVRVIWESESSQARLQERQDRTVVLLLKSGLRFRAIWSIEQARDDLRAIELERLSQANGAGQ